LSSKLSLFFRFADTPSSTASRPYFARTMTTSDAQTYTLGANSQFSSWLTNEFRLGYARSDSSQIGVIDSFGGATPVDLSSAMGAGGLEHVLPVMSISISGIGAPLLIQYNTRSMGRQWNLVDNTSLLTHRHTLRFGIDFRHIKSPLTPPGYEPYGVFTDPSQLLAGAPLAPYVFRFLPATPIFDQTALFIEDEWHAHPRLNLSFGLRWEVNPPPTEQHGKDAYTLLGSIGNPSSLALAPQGTPLWKTTWLNFAPRAGVAWKVRNSPRFQTVLRFGGGAFFDSANEVATLGFDGLGFRASAFYSGATLPFTTGQLNVPVNVSAPYTSATVTAFPSHLQLPYTLQWNTAVQQSLGDNQSITLSYVGAAGRRLIQLQEHYLASHNPNFGYVQYFASGVSSNYQAFQMQFQRSIARGIQAIASYTWSHALDFGSSATALPLERGNADYDVRHSLQGILSWEMPGSGHSGLERALLHDWGLDARVNVRTAFPVTLVGSNYFDPGSGQEYNGGLNLVSGQSVYLHGSAYPGGKAINPAAFSLPASGAAGTAPRNFVRGFGETELNLAARREFHLHDSVRLQFRAETFNILNHPNFGYVDPIFTDATFGQATAMLNSSLGTVAPQYQQGGARSMQFALRLRF
jgi:hypothetical protein